MDNCTSSPNEFKTCSNKDECVNPLGSVLPLTQFHKDRRSKDGTRNQCKACACKQKRDEHKENPEKSRQRQREHYKNNSELVKAQNKKYYLAHKSEIAQRNKEWRSSHTEEIREYQKKYREQNADEIKTKKKEYHQKNIEKIRAYDSYRRVRDKDAINKRQKEYRVKNSEKIKQKNRRYYIENAETQRNQKREWRKNNRDIDRERSNTYQKTHPSIVNVAKNRRRARKLALPSTLTTKQWQRALEYFGHACAYCGQPAGLWHTIAQDHYMPLSNPNSKGHTVQNVLPSCHARKGVPAGTPCCNNSKSNKNPEIWIREHFGNAKAKSILKRIREYFDWVREQDAASDANAQTDAA